MCLWDPGKLNNIMGEIGGYGSKIQQSFGKNSGNENMPQICTKGNL
jgi:hypothetical protein